MKDYQLMFSQDFDQSDLKLLKLPKHVLEQLELGNEVHIKGMADQKAILCTPTETYSMVEVETSNMHLLLPSHQWDLDDIAEGTVVTCIDGTVSSYFELSRVFPKPTLIRQLLMECPYSGVTQVGMIENENQKGKCYTLQDIVDRVQFSSSEILKIFDSLHAIEIDGYWRIFDEHFMETTFSQMIDLIIENEWDIQDIDAQTISTCLDMKLMDITYILKIHSIHEESSGKDGKWSLDPHLVARTRSKELLKKKYIMNQLWEKDEFLETVNVRLPDSCVADASTLEGLCITEEKNGKEILQYFPVSQLSDDPKECFDQIFSFRERWTLNDLTCYISHMITPLLTQTSLLLTYTRSSLINGTSGDRIYSRR